MKTSQILPVIVLLLSSLFIRAGQCQESYALRQNLLHTATACCGKKMWSGFGLATGKLGCAAALSNVINKAGLKCKGSAYNQNQVTKACRTTSGAVLLATEHKSTTANTSQGPFGSSSTTYGIGAFSTAAIDYQAIFHLTFAFHDFRIGQSGNADIGD